MKLNNLYVVSSHAETLQLWMKTIAQSKPPQKGKETHKHIHTCKYFLAIWKKFYEITGRKQAELVATYTVRFFIRAICAVFSAVAKLRFISHIHIKIHTPTVDEEMKQP